MPKWFLGADISTVVIGVNGIRWGTKYTLEELLIRTAEECGIPRFFVSPTEEDAVEKSAVEESHMDDQTRVASTEDCALFALWGR